MKLLLIDGNSLLFRAYYATAFAGTDNIMRTSTGFPTNAIYGLANLVTKVLNDENPDYALVAFDTSKPTFRHQEYQEYKAGRAATPEELKQQFQPARELLRQMGLYVFEIEGYEADDIVGTTSKMVDDSFDVDIYSGDKDLLQLINENTTVCLTKKGVSDVKRMTIESLMEEMGVTPTQITDLKGLMGDSSDNIPGVPGVGDKTAVKLLKEYGTVEAVVEADIKGKLGEKIKANKDLALMSKKIATINVHVPVPYTLEDLKYNGPKETLSNFFREYEMFSLDKRLKFKKESKVSEEKPIQEPFDFKLVDKIPESFLNNELFINLELKGDNYHIDEIVGLGLSNGKDNYFIKINDLLNDENLVKYLNSDVSKTGFDIKKIIVGLHRYGIDVNGLNNDILLGTYLLESSLKDDPAILFNYYNKTLEYRSEIYKRNVEEAKSYEYGSKIAYLMSQIKDLMLNSIKEKELEYLYNEIEIPVAKILAQMEINGIRIDANLLADKTFELKNKLDDLVKTIYEQCGYEFNVNSPAQVAEVLFDKLNLPANKKRSTSTEELMFLSQFHPVCKTLIEYRSTYKLFNSYYVPLKDYILKDGRVHTIYNQALTTTGRLSSKYPNMQNISIRTEEGKIVRKAFVSDENKVLISFDYSQIELRVLAEMANVKLLKEAFINGVDIHTNTAARVFNVREDQVDKSLRRKAKVINFGIIYGMSEFELANELEVTYGQAREFMNSYFSTYPEIKEYFNKVITDATNLGYTKTLFNRQRTIKELRSTVYLEREKGKRMAMNAPIQGTAADLVKLSMIRVFNKIKSLNLDVKMLLQVHDEFVFEVNEKDLETIIPIIKNCMEDFKEISVPLVVDYHYGKNWGE